MGPDGVRRPRGSAPRSRSSTRRCPAIYANIAEILRAAYAKVGVELVLRPLDWAAYTQRVRRGRFDAGPVGGQPLPPNLDPRTRPSTRARSPPAGAEHRLLQEPGSGPADGSGQRGRWTRARGSSSIAEIHRLIAADPPADFMWAADQYWGVSTRLQGVETWPSGLFHFLPGPLGWRPAAAAGKTARDAGAARRDPGPGPVAGSRGPLLHDAARRPRRARHQGRASRDGATSPADGGRRTTR